MNQNNTFNFNQLMRTIRKKNVRSISKLLETNKSYAIIQPKPLNQSSILKAACLTQNTDKINAVSRYLNNNFQTPQLYECTDDDTLEYFLNYHETMPYIVSLIISSINEHQFSKLCSIISTHKSIENVTIQSFSGKITKSHVQKMYTQYLKYCSDQLESVSIRSIRIIPFNDLKPLKILETRSKNNIRLKTSLLMYAETEKLIEACKDQKIRLFFGFTTEPHESPLDALNFYQLFIKHLQLDVSRDRSYFSQDNVCDLFHLFYNVVSTFENIGSINVIDPVCTKKTPILFSIIRCLDDYQRSCEYMNLFKPCKTCSKWWDFYKDTRDIHNQPFPEHFQPKKIGVCFMRLLLQKDQNIILDIEDTYGITAHTHLYIRDVIKLDERIEDFGLSIQPQKNPIIEDMIEKLPEPVMHNILSFVSDKIDCVLTNYCIKRVNTFFCRSVYKYHYSILEKAVTSPIFTMDDFTTQFKDEFNKVQNAFNLNRVSDDSCIFNILESHIKNVTSDLTLPKQRCLFYLFFLFFFLSFPFL